MHLVRLSLVICLSLLPASAAAQPPPAEDPAPGSRVAAGTDIVAATAYVWRGFVPVPSLTFQPSVFVTVGDLTFTSWSNLARRGPNGRTFTEHDFVADYSRGVGAVTVSAGWVAYAFPDLTQDTRTHELYAGLAFGGPAAPFVRVYQDLGAGDGTYVQAGVSHEWRAGRHVTVGASLSGGYNHHQWVAGSGFSDLLGTVRASLPTPIARLRVEPFLSRSHTLDRQRFPSRTFGGVGLTIR
ncbi:MAG: hypothetical protein Q8L86_04120 [Vicinamibacterales bacterium]|nr:hypothetical protein [Vicinamibacterales bacterium]